ncbi:centromere protein F [Osmerus eperlanus]|uniref:centromere protein F n=1 Tax=Osmerus eperlanus TaxID=29151 RepID=UPI002E13AC42
MSWAVEEWKDGLSGKALQKVQELEGQLDKYKKEKNQKQFQLDSLEAALQKQKQKMDSEKSEASALKRENQSLLESCDSLEKARQKASHDLTVKEQQVNYLEGQLSASKRTIERLEQELKKYKNDFDRSQTSNSSDLQSYCTPQKTFATPAATPSFRQNDSRLEDLQERYNHELEERKRLEAELKIMQVKLLNQSSVSHKDIAARQQAGSSIFPWQQLNQSQSRQSQGAIETPLKRRGGATSSGFMWNAEETPVKTNQRISASVSHGDSGDSSHQPMEQLRTLNHELKSKVGELEQRVAAQDREVKSQTSRLQELQGQLDQARRDLTEKDRVLGKTRDDVAKATTQHEQAVAKCASVEQKLKQVSEEISCQRHNAESSKRALEQKIKDQEKESQKELAHLQSSHQALDQQFNQTKTKLNQEIQQAKKDHNIVQSELEKVTFQKGQMEKEVEEQKQKLFRSEQSLQASQTKELDIRKKFEELQKEKNNLSSQLEQGSRKLSQLEEERKTWEQNLKRSQNMVEDLRAKTEAQGEEMKGLKTKLESQAMSSSQDLENLKKSLSDTEAKIEKSHGELQKQKQEVEQLSIKLVAMENENKYLKATLGSSQKECVDLRKEHETLLQWKTEKETLINDTETVQQGLTSRISELEKSVVSLNDDHSVLKDLLKTVEEEKASLCGQIDSLKGELLNKCTELEEKERLREELLAQLSEVGQKHSKDLENLGLQVTRLEDQVKDLESRLQQESERAERAERSHVELSEQYQVACDMAQSKDSVIELGQAEVSRLRESVAQASAQLDQQQARLAEERGSLLRECEESVAAKVEEAEQAKLGLIKSQQELSFFQDQLSSLESALKFHKDLGADLQIKFDDLVKTKDDLLEKLSEAEKRKGGLQTEIDALSERAMAAAKLQELCDALTAADQEKQNALQNMSEALAQTENDIKTLTAQTNAAEDKVSEVEKLNEQLSEKVQEIEKEGEAKYQSLHDSLNEEKDILLKQISAFKEELSEKEASAEMLPALKTELEEVNQMCADLRKSLDALEKSHASALEHNANLENSVEEKIKQIASQENEIKDVSQRRHDEFEKLKEEQERKCKEAAEAKELWESASSELSKLREDGASRDGKLKEVDEAYNLACQEVENWKEAVSNQQKEMKSMKSSLSAATNGLEEKDNEIKYLKDKLNHAQAEQAKATDALKEKVMSMNKIKVQLEMLQMDLEDNEACISSYEAQIEELRGTVAALEVRLAESETRRSTLEQELGEIKTQRSVLETRFESLEEELSSRSTEVTQLAASLEDAHRQNQTHLASADQVSSLQATVDGVLEQLEEEVRKRGTVVAGVLQLEANVAQLTGEKLQLNANLAQLTGEKLQLNANLAQLTEEKLQLNANVAQLTEEKLQLDANVVQLTEEKLQLDANVAQLTGEKLQLDANVVQLTEEKLQLDANVAQLTGEKLQLDANVVQLTEEKFQLDANVAQLTGEKLQLDANVVQLTEEKLQLDADLKRHELNSRDEVEAVKRENERLQAALLSLTEDHEGLKVAVERADRSKEEAGVRNQEFEREQAELHRRLAGLQEESNSFKEQYDGLLAQVTEQQCRLLQLHTEHVQQEEVRRTSESMVVISSTLEEEDATASGAKPSDRINSSMEGVNVGGEEPSMKSEEWEELSGVFEELLQTMEEKEEERRTSLSPPQEPLEQQQHPAQQEASDSIEDLICTAAPEPIESANGSITGSSSPTTTTPPHPHPVRPGSDLETSGEAVQRLQGELLSLHAHFDLLTSEMALRKELCAQLEVRVQAAEEERCGSMEKLSVALEERREMEDKLSALMEEADSLRLQLQTSKCQLSDVLELLENLEVAKGGWDERFLQQESELKRVRSEKANLESHILSMEADLETMQGHKLRLEGEVEAQRRAASVLEQQLGTLGADASQLRTELGAVTEDRDELGLSLARWKDEAENLEKTNVDTRELIKILEEDIREGKKELGEAVGSLESLQKEKEQLAGQCRALEEAVTLESRGKEEILKELNAFKDDRNAACLDSESMVTKIQSLEGEVSRLAQSLESSLLEKGEIASRLNSTQDEVRQMRSGIEKLQVRIESDEKKKKHMDELLKSAQRKAESLQDRIESLEREGEVTEGNLEDAIMQSEAAKAELEGVEEEKQALEKRIEETTEELNNLRAEKERLEKELFQKNAEIQELKAAKQAAATELREKEAEREDLQKSAEEWRREGERLRALEETWQQERERLAKAEGEGRRLEKEEWEAERERLEREKGVLQASLSSVEKERDEQEEERMRLKEERESLRSSVLSLESAVSQLQHQIQISSLFISQLTQEGTALQQSNGRLQSDLEDALKEAKKLREDLEQDKTALSSQLQQQAESYKLSLEEVTSEKEELRCQLASMQEEKKEEEEKKKEEVLKQTQQQVSELSSCVARLSKERDSALSKMNLWMKSCKQLEKEKEALLQEGHQQGELIANLQSSKTGEAGGESSEEVLAELQELKRALEEREKELEERSREVEESKKEVEELSEALEERGREADESLDKYCSLMVRVHKLEETNDSLKTRLEQINQQASSANANQGSRTPRRQSRKSTPRTQEAVTEDTENKAGGQGSGKRGSGKRGNDGDKPSKAQETLHNLAKRIKAGAVATTPKQGSHQEEEEFRPEGLPELVQRGFADIPLGEASPFIIRRTTVQQRCSPRLAAQHTSASSQNQLRRGALSPAEDGKLPKVLEPLCLQSPVVKETPVTDSPDWKGLCVSPAPHSRESRGRRSLSMRKTPEQREKRREALNSTQGEENCQVQ